MNKLRTSMITLALVGSLMVGVLAAEAAAGGNGKSSSDKGSKPSSSHVEKGGSSVEAKEAQTNNASQTAKVEAKATKKVENAAKFQAKREAKDFKDTKSYWAEVPIMRLQLLGAVSGFPDGGFHPEEAVTEEQVIAMIMGALDTQEEATAEEVAIDTTNTDQTNTDEENQDETTTDTEDQDELSDVPDWAKEVVGRAKEKGILNLDRFHSGVQASRVQSMVWVAKAMGLQPEDTSTLPFNDGTLVSPEDIGYVMALYNEGIVKGGPGGMLNPNSSITRAQIAALIDRVLTQQQEQNQDANTLQAVETADGNQVLKIGTGDDATEVTLADDVLIYINGQIAEVSDLVTGSPVRVLTNQEGKAVLVEQTVEADEQDTDTTTTDTNNTDTDSSDVDSNDTTSETSNDTTSDTTTDNTDDTETTSENTDAESTTTAS